MELKQTKVAMIVTEFGANWTPWAERFRGDAANIVVVSQFYGESPEAFAVRVGERVEKFARDCVSLRRAVIVSNGRTDRPSMLARASAIQAIAEAMGPEGGGRVLLGHADERDHRSLVRLANKVQPLVVAKGVSVHHAPVEAERLSQVA